jgi:hypothetical protein
MRFVRAALECGGTIDGMLPVSELKIRIRGFVHFEYVSSVGNNSRPYSGVALIEGVSYSKV